MKIQLYSFRYFHHGRGIFRGTVSPKCGVCNWPAMQSWGRGAPILHKPCAVLHFPSCAPVKG